MRHLGTWTAAALAAAVVMMSAGTAFADPAPGGTPKPPNVVGVSGDTMGSLLDQLAAGYGKGHSTKLYSFDGTNPYTGASDDQITTKQGCAPIERPEGDSTEQGDNSSLGGTVPTLAAGTKDPAATSDYCVDFAGVSRSRGQYDQQCEQPQAGNENPLCFVALAGDAITYATRDAASGGSNAPATPLTRADLVKIYTCQVTNWVHFGGAYAPIEAFLPETPSRIDNGYFDNSGLAAQFLLELGGGAEPITPGPCVSYDESSVGDNEGTAPSLNSPNTIVPYSVGDYIAQVYHSAACLNTACTPVDGTICKPSKSQNQYGCDVHGVLGLNEITGAGGGQPAPTTPWPLPAGPASPTINPRYDPLFQHTLYDVVRYSPTTDHIPANLEPIFAANGWACTNATAKQEIKDYGFLPTWKSSTCGTAN